MCVCLGNHVHILAIILASILAAKTSSSSSRGNAGSDCGSGSGSAGIWVKVAQHMPLINLCMPRIDFHASQTQQRQQQQRQQLEQQERLLSAPPPSLPRLAAAHWNPAKRGRIRAEPDNETALQLNRKYERYVGVALCSCGCPQS